MSAIPLRTLRIGDRFSVPNTTLIGRLLKLRPGSATVRYDDETRSVEISPETMVRMEAN